MKRLGPGEYRMRWNIYEEDSGSIAWGKLFDWTFTVAGILLLVVLMALWRGEQAESDCLKFAVNRGLELSEEEARNADWQTYYAEALAVCQVETSDLVDLDNWKFSEGAD